MAQSLSNVLVHLVWSTKGREPYLKEELRSELKAMMTGVLKRRGCPLVVMEVVEDHVHILFALARVIALAVIVRDLKAVSSKWVKNKREELQGFSWQKGYGAFSVSESRCPVVVGYIKNQETHHTTQSFEDEFVTLLKAHKIAFDERYLWD